MLSVLLLAAAMTTQAADTGDAYRACVDIKRSRARLACYDEAASKDAVLIAEAEAVAEEARLAAEAAEAAAQAARVEQAATSPAPITTPAPNIEDEDLAAAQARAAAAERRAQEAERELQEARARADKIERDNTPIPSQFTAGVDAIGFGPSGEMILLLDDGMVWRQIRADGTIPEKNARFVKQVKVTQGALGSWRMKLMPLNKTIKVRPRED
ncbi:hypothetical protein HK107_04790 [Parvularcula sp. ZS-1/3]|uniref:Uncharacterized protein n=1 Tax=Parvularcula mediterranea TaxID=2732508 RepID=A0A7Y3RKB3_9PROT|nr:hypothetical protein [Parvularcula mediterranea]NNU15633.1 hypothetical protein [Parvularcula mediterranea]